MPFPAPLVTRVMTSFNDARFLERAVASALAQRGLPDGAVEVVAVDDGSTDGTLELLEGMGGPVRVLRQDRLGPAVGMHRGIAAAAGRYVSMLDADDEWLPGKLASALAIFEARPEVGLVYGDAEHIDADGNVIQPSHFGANGLVPPVGRVLGRFVKRNYATTTMITLPTELARALPPTPDWAWCRDWWVATQVARTHELDYVTEPITRYRLHGANMSASDDGQPEKTLRLFHRDLRVRRIFMRELDLSSATIDELAAAWERHVHYVNVLVRHRGVAATEVLPVSDADRAEAADAVRIAQGALGEDPATAGRLAVRALGADPFSAPAQALLARARELAAAPAHRRPPLRSAAQAARLRDLRERRAAVTAARGLAERLSAYHRFESLHRTLAGSGTPVAELGVVSAAERDHALDAIEAGLQAAADTRHEDAALAFAGAVAATPGDEHARLALDAALAALAGQPPRRAGADARAAVLPAPLGELDGARAFVRLALAAEPVADPALLAASARAFDEDDDATLVIYAAGGDEAAVVADLGPAIAAAGIDDDDGRDLALVVGPATAAREAGLARGASALLTRAPARAAFAALPAVCAAADLRRHAEERLGHGGLGRPIGVAVKLCAKDWSDAAQAPDLPVALAIAEELERRGHRALVQVAAEWDGAEGRACDVALALRGPWPYVPQPGQPSVLWDRGGDPELRTPGEAARYDAVLTAGDDVTRGVDGFLAAVAPLVGATPALAG